MPGIGDDSALYLLRHLEFDSPCVAAAGPLLYHLRRPISFGNLHLPLPILFAALFACVSPSSPLLSSFVHCIIRTTLFGRSVP